MHTNERKYKVLMISLDKGLFEPGQVRNRIINQCRDCVHTTILVFGKRKFNHEVAPNVEVFSTASWNRLFYVWDACRIAFKMRKRGWDVVVAQDPVEAGFVGAFAARMAGCALAIQDHGYFFHGDYFRKETFLNRFRYLFARWLVKRADAVRVVSVRTEKVLVDLGVAKDKIVRFPLALNSTQHAVRSTQHDGERAEDGIREDGPSYTVHRTPYFLIACRFVPIKRLDLAIHAFSLVADKHPDLKLKIVGRGPLENFVRDKISEFKLNDKVEVIPWTDSLQDLYRGAAATLITSDREGFGMTAVESLINGTPVIMTDVGCAGEVVKDGVNGYVVPVGDVDGLAKRMEDVLAQSVLFKEGLGILERPGSYKGMADLVDVATKTMEAKKSVIQSSGGTGLAIGDEAQLKMLFVTQVADKRDPILGFAIRWIQEFVNQNVKMTVFARRMVKNDLPESVIGVNMGQPIVRRVLKMWWYSIKLRREYDAVLVHMTPQLVVLGAPLWKMMGKRVYMWYMHRSVTWWLKVALWMTEKTFTASELSLRVSTPKKTVVGHGIDTEQFKPIEGVKREPVVLWVSRIQPRKHLEKSLEFMAAFKDAYPDATWKMRIIGTAQGNEGYLESCKERAVELGIADRLVFSGPLVHDALPEVFASAAAFISTSETGSIDKVVLEALASGTPVLAAGEEYMALGGVTDIGNLKKSHSVLCNSLFGGVDSEAARVEAVNNHDLKRLIGRLIGNIRL